MHEFLLFGQVANDDHHKLLQQLAGVTRMQPQHVVERHLIFKARTPIGLGNIPSGGGSQGVLPPEVQRTKQMLTAPIFYLQLIGTLQERGAQADHLVGSSAVNSGDTVMKDEKVEESANGTVKMEDCRWALEFRDIPDPGKQAVTTRLMSRTTIESGDMITFVRDLGFDFVSQYVLEGHKFYDQDTTLFLHQVLQLPQASTEPTVPEGRDIPAVRDLQPLDGRKGFVLQASIEALDGNNLEVKEKAAQQLFAMREILKQAVTLEPGDRLALDTRVLVRNRP